MDEQTPKTTRNVRVHRHPRVTSKFDYRGNAPIAPFKNGEGGSGESEGDGEGPGQGAGSEPIPFTK